METAQTIVHQIGREKVSNDQCHNRLRAVTDVSRGTNTRTFELSRSGNLPRGFESMLKTTTETGDIGMFSIKPSRLPPSFNTPRRSSGAHSDSDLQRPKPHFQPYGVPNFDDRHRLPSYTRGTAPDVMSICDSTNQKSANRAFDEPDYRSCSMTQTSYSSYTLSNHKSYASLRSQQEITGGGLARAGGILQRPRSPFAYPTRLKRPGFRPSSPALTDGGFVDYSRRAEIDRLIYDPSHTTSSPSSLYALRRKPLHALRPEANRSAPFPTLQPSPHRRSSSPQGFLYSGNYWPRKNGAASTNTSPARSTFSLASTANLRASATATSVTTTPGRLPPPSPSYYDYTEEFEVDERHPPGELIPVLFKIDQTIPEEHPISSRSPATELDHDNGWRASLSLPLQIPRYSRSPSNLNVPDHLEKDVENRAGCVIDSDSQIFSVFSEQMDDTQDKSFLQLAGLGCGAGELSSHVEGAFGLDLWPSFKVTMPQSTIQTTSTKDHRTLTADVCVDEPANTLLSTSSADFQSSRLHPTHYYRLPRDLIDELCTQETRTHLLPQTPRESTGYSHGRQVSQELNPQKESRGRSSLGVQRGKALSGDFDNLARLYHLNESVVASKSAGSPSQMDLITTTIQGKAVNNPLILSNTSGLRPITLSISHTFPASSHLQHSTSETHQALQNGVNNLNSDCYDEPPSTLPEYISVNAPSYSHQIGKSVVSPMLAPKPISPVRQLRLKNSIPHLMKALPPLPPELELRVPSQAVTSKFDNSELPRRFSPVALNTMPETTQETEEIPTQRSPKLLISEIVSVSQAKTPTSETCQLHFRSWDVRSTAGEQAPQPPPKLKLRLKPSNTLQLASLAVRHPWDFEKENTWSNEDINPAQLQTQRENSQKQARFRLKVTRSSLKQQGTVRVNRSSSDAKPKAGPNLGNPKDLFTPTSRIENIFRQVSRHVHSRRTSTASSLQLENELATPPSLVHLQFATSTVPILESSEIHLKPPSNALAPCEVQSCFSDDSSQEERQNSLRRRLTHLRTKIPVPYVSKVGTQSYDDITWKDRNGGENPILTAKRSTLDFHDNRASTDAKHTRRFAERLHQQKLKAKMQNWLKGARAFFTAHVKPQSTTSMSHAVENGKG